MTINTNDPLALQRRIEELETALVAQEQENKRLLRKERIMRMNETKLLEVQRIAAISSWELNMFNGRLDCSDEVLELIGKTDSIYAKLEDLFNVVHPEDRELFQKKFEASLKEEQPNEMIHRIVSPAGEVCVVNHYFKTFFGADGIPLKSMGLIQDITDRKQMEDDLHKRVKELDEAQSAMLNMMEDLDEEKAKAEAATRAKGDFLANMSHEIRTPMNAVIGMAHLALKTELTTKQRDYLNKIQSSAKSLLGIINDILDFSKIEAGKLDIESVEFNLDDVLDNLANLVTVKAREKEALEVLFSVEPKIPRFLVGDPLRLGQILINLTNNAVKFTDSGEIVVSTELLEQDEAGLALKFSVRDTGIGLTEDQIGKLFQSFSQADTSTTRKFGGTGLGLTISKLLVEMMDGEIWVESEPGKGSTFSFTCKFALGKKKVRERLVPSPDLRGMKVLVVDDSATSRNILKEMLESFSFEVISVASAEEGLEEIQNADTDQPYELVLMDWKMPGLDGLEASEHIKNHQDLGKIPAIILVTAYGREEIMQRAEQIGLEGFLIKPVSPSVLLDTIMHAFGERRPETSRMSEETEKIEDLKNIRGAHVLLAEDNEINQQVAMEILQGAGLIVTVANDGQEAVHAVKERHYDAVLMDIQMPVMDGYLATRKIRKHNTMEELPIIAMTASAMTQDREEAIEAGMNGHVAKPIDTKELFSTLVKWIEPGERELPGETVEKVSEPEMEKAILPAVLPGISITSGLSKVAGNEELYRKLLFKFRASNKDVVNEIKSNIDAGDMEAAARMAHTVKGVAGNLGAEDLFPAAGELEKAIKQGETGSFDTLIEHFDVLLNVVLHGIEDMEQKGAAKKETETPDGETTIDIDAVKPLLAEMAQLLETDFSEAVNRVSDLKSYLGHSPVSGEYKELQTAMEEFDTDRALKSIEKISKSLNIYMGS